VKKEQAEAVAEALLQPGRKEQSEFAHRAETKSSYLQSRERKVWALLALIGLATGAILGHFAFGQIGNGTLLGFAVGSIVGVLLRGFVRRRRAP
jgi:hypothetical protein